MTAAIITLAIVASAALWYLAPLTCLAVTAFGALAIVQIWRVAGRVTRGPER